MARIKIKDLPKDMKISKKEMKKVVGGALITGTADVKISEFYGMPSSIIPELLPPVRSTPPLEVERKASLADGEGIREEY